MAISFLFLLLTLFFRSESATPGRVVQEDSFQRVYHESFTAPEGTELYLEADGRVEIEVWDRPEVDVRVDYHVRERYLWRRSRGRDRGYGVEMYKRGNRIVVKAKRPSVIGIGISVWRDNNYQLKVPPYVKLDIHGDDDPLSISGVQGEVKVISDDGEIRLDGINSPRIRIESDDGDIILKEVVSAGLLTINSDDGDMEIYDSQAQELSVSTDDGDIDLSNVRGDILIHTGDGRINLIDVDASSLEIKTGDGTVRVETTIHSGGTYRISTEDGNIYLTIPGDCSARFDATTEGRFDIDLPIEMQRVSKHNLRGRLGKGEATIRLWSEHGDITINAR